VALPSRLRQAGAGTAEPEGPPSTGFVAASYVVVVLLTVLLTLWGAFLVPFRVGGVLVPVCWLVAALGNAGVALLGSRLLGSPGAAVPGLVWVALVFTLVPRRTEGDLVLPANYVALGYLLIGAVASAVAWGFASARARSAAAAATPARPARR
jgi:hypothetical protein